MRHILQNKNGLTLIEVLIALAILSIALTAIIRTTSQNIKNTWYLQNKMTAEWVASYAMNNVRAGVLQLTGSSYKQNIEMLGRHWTYEAKLVSTPNKNIKEIDIDVSQESDENPLAHLVSYIYVRS